MESASFCAFTPCPSTGLSSSRYWREGQDGKASAGKSSDEATAEGLGVEAQDAAMLGKCEMEWKGEALDLTGAVLAESLSSQAAAGGKSDCAPGVE
jgi:hypothetical protein